VTRLEITVGRDSKVAIDMQDRLNCRPCHGSNRQQRVALLYRIHRPHVYSVSAHDQAVRVCQSRVAVSCTLCFSARIFGWETSRGRHTHARVRTRTWELMLKQLGSDAGTEQKACAWSD
jgi:hypothetical protein